MIRDRRALDPDVQPDVVVHRDGELDAIARAIDPTVGRPRPVFLFGPSGAGKTTVAREALRRAEAELMDISTAYVPCARKSRAAILRDLVGEVIGSHAVYPSKGSAELLADLDGWNRDLLVVLDEIDQLADLDILRDCYDLDGCRIIAIANDEASLFASVDGREPLDSRLSVRETVRFLRYTDDELVSILETRVTQAFGEVTWVRNATLEHAADLAAGDARKAIALLQAGARAVERGDAGRLTGDVIESQTDAAVETLTQSALAKLNCHTTVVYEVLVDAEDGLRSGEIYDRYCGRVDNAVSRRTLGKYLAKLESYGLVADNGEATTRRRYRPVEPL